MLADIEALIKSVLAPPPYAEQMTARERIEAKIKQEITTDAIAMLMPMVHRRLGEMPGDAVLGWYVQLGGLLARRIQQLQESRPKEGTDDGENGTAGRRGEDATTP